MRRAMIACIACLLALPAAAQEPAGSGDVVANPFKPFDRAAYEQRLSKLGATPAQLTIFAEEIEEYGVSRAADRLMQKVLPAFGEAVVLAFDRQPRAALALAELLGNADETLGAHVRYHMAQVFLEGDDPERAVEILNEYLRQNINLTPLDGEAAYYYAQALAEIPMMEHALPRFRAFLQWFPDASERFRSAAQSRIAEIEGQQDSRLHALADDMKRVTRDLKKQKTDDPVQTDQLEMIEELNELIEMYEEMERQSSGGSASGNQQSQGPATQSSLPEGEARVGELKNRVSTADRWGDMRDQDRKEIESQVQNKLPPQYRKMLEQYFKKLGTGGAGSR
jgi:tetratricopeptide (TPR) repeat protein